MRLSRRMLHAIDRRVTKLLDNRRDDVEQRWTVYSGRTETERWAPGEGGRSVVWIDGDGRPWPLDADQVADLLWTAAPVATAEAAIAGLVDLIAAGSGDGRT